MPPRPRILALAFLGNTLAAGAGGAQDSALTSVLVASRRPVQLVNDRLEGPGGRFLVDEGMTARFFMVGEEHGIAQAPGVVKALLEELRPAGYDVFAIEVSPLQGARLDAMARRPNARAALDTLLSTWFTTIPFYSLAEERDLLGSAMTPLNSAPAMGIWGLDYDVSGDRFFLRELESLAPPSGRPAVRRARELADSGFARLTGQGNPSGLFAWSATDSVFAALRAAFNGRPPARAAEIIDVFERTARINRLFLSGRGYESNQMRSAWLRENFMRRFSEASAGSARVPRVLLKFGGSHLMRGFNYTHTLDIGTAAQVVAESRREKAFGLLVVGGPGTKTARMNILKGQYEPTGSAELDGADLAWLRPAVAESGWSLFDMREVRRAWLARRGASLPAIQDRFFHAWDAVLVLRGSTPGANVPIAFR